MHLRAMTHVDEALGQGGRITLLVIGRPGCDDCTRWHHELEQWEGFPLLDIVTLNIRSELGSSFKEANTWASHIDMVPFNVLYVNGEACAHWNGGQLTGLTDRLAQTGGSPSS